MTKLRLFTIVCIGFLLVFVYGCNKASEETNAEGIRADAQEEAAQAGEGEEAGTNESERGEHEGEARGEHAGEGERGEHEGEGSGEHGGEGGESGEGEETGPRLAKDGTHDEVRKGVRLILAYDSKLSSFVGTVENVSEKTVSKVRIEVHLSNGTELGPTNPIELAPGKKVTVGLSAEGQSFEWWKAHAEAGDSEH